MNAIKQTRMTQKEFDKLPEYSCSIPTLTTVGKRWKRNLNFGKKTTDEDWLICEFVECDPPIADKVRIISSRPYIMDEDETLLRNRLYG